ncbi:oxidoreductase, partial [Actinotalea fermentans ATCC 43279 = JCM 9966 = DSM 3133]
AIAASGTATADGWSVWRLGDGGPTLTDAFREQYA